MVDYEEFKDIEVKIVQKMSIKEADKNILQMGDDIEFKEPNKDPLPMVYMGKGQFRHLNIDMIASEGMSKFIMSRFNCED